MKEVLRNPFVIGRYISDYYFCDREEETNFLIKQILNGRDVALISPRRLGKSGLIRHTFEQPIIKQNYRTIFVDIYMTTNLGEFTSLLSQQIFEEIIKKDKTLFRKALDIIKSLRPLVKIDAVTGEPTMELSVAKIANPELTLKEIFSYLENSEIPCILAIDEFQQISSYKESEVEARLRTLIQQCKQTHFIFAGSEQTLMTEIFTSSRKPFYQSSITMGLQPIPSDKYVEFASNLYRDYKKIPDVEIFKEIYERFDGITWFVQMIMNEVFALTDINCAPPADAISIAEKNIISVQDVNYKETMARLSSRQRELLRAMVRYPDLCGELMSTEFIKASGFPTPSVVQAALNGLIKNGIVTRINGIYIIYDRFFSRWIELSSII